MPSISLRQERILHGHIRPWFFFVLAVFCLNLVQIIFTELTSDEGYYWFYATHLQWGYYDHPPMVALAIKAGTLFFGGEAGVRIVNLLLMTGANILFFKLLPEQYRNTLISFLLLLSVPLLNYLNFIVFPDGALLFFSLLFLHGYRRFLQQQNLKTALAIGVSAAFMLYAKYHGVLVLVFCLLAFPGILKSVWLWVAGLFALAVFLPHLVWQYEHDFPTFRYHLGGRSGNFSLSLALQFLSQQVVAIGPALIFLPFVVRSRDVFERCLFFIIAGSFLFFFISSFNTFVHFHWTSIAIYPLLYFAVRYYHEPNRIRLFLFLVMPLVLLFMVFRLLLIFDVGVKKVGEDVYHGRQQWAEEITALSNGNWVLFPNNLREAPLYQFYSSSKKSAALYNRPEKKSQYELWNYEDSLQGRKVLVLNKYPIPGGVPFKTSTGAVYYYYRHENFRSFFNGVTILPVPERGDSKQQEIIIRNDRNDDLLFPQRTSLIYSIVAGQETIGSGKIADLPATTLQPDQRLKLQVRFTPNLPQQRAFNVYFGFAVPGLPESYNSEPIAVGRR